MIFLLPLGAIALKATVATVTAAKVATTAAIVGSGILLGKVLHEAGRREGHAEGKESLL